MAELAKSGPCRQPSSLRLSTCLAKRCKKGFGFAIEVAPVKLSPSQVCKVKSAKPGEREESSGLERKAWAAGEAEPGKVRQVLNIVNSLVHFNENLETLNA